MFLSNLNYRWLSISQLYIFSLLVITGFGTIVTGIFLLHAFKDINFSLKDLPKFAKNGVEGLHGMNEEQNIEGHQQSRFVLFICIMDKNW